MSILNKVSPENMHLLTKQIMALPIDSEQCLEKAIDLLFQKVRANHLNYLQFQRLILFFLTIFGHALCRP